jgi:hypothetical protein
MNILDLSASPKTFATRRMIRQGQFGSNLSNSPTKSITGKPNKHSAWRMQNMRTDVISTAIPEAGNDEESQDSTMVVKKIQPIDMKKSPEIVIKDVTEVEREIEIESEAIGCLKENLFIKQEENNFTENEIREHKKTANVNLQQQRAQFLFGIGNSDNSAINASKASIHNRNSVVDSTATNAKTNNALTASLETAL